MKSISYSVLTLLLILASGCITQFVPETKEDPNLLVVEGLITDQPESYKIKLSRSMPLGDASTPRPLSNCTVTVTDNFGNTFNFWETPTNGTYASDSSVFQGVVGRKYTLHISTNSSTVNGYSYTSAPVEMNPVPQIDSLYWKKVTIVPSTLTSGTKEGCQIYLNTYDRDGSCKYYRWNFTETWEIRVPYAVPNNDCWVTSASDYILIKNTSVLNEDMIENFPVNYITYETDRLSVKYSILVNQYSLNEDEFSYWDKVKNITGNVGGLYDVIPASITGNIYCVEDPAEQVLGYFSVSAKNSKRIFIDRGFMGIINPYANCATDTIYGNASVLIPGLNISEWVIDDQSGNMMNPFRIITNKRFCADCTTRGTTVKPAYWEGD